ncbi:MAG TPA: formate dehydrogenase subunit gamma [Clostridia bacterium]|nr:formate dehydrogenase subunit gamma [Clostridia bacterium]
MRDRIYRFSKTARVVHWLYVACYVVLLFTGLLLFTDWFDFLAPIFGGFRGAQIVHRVVAIIFILPALIFMLFDFKNFKGWLKESFTWTRDDFRALPQLVRKILGLKADVPPQGFINAGEKLNSLMVMVFTVVIILSGFVKWFPGHFDIELVRWASAVHSGAVALMTPICMVHMYLGLISPNSKASLSGMIYGWVDAAYAKEHHEKWYHEVMSAKK